MADKDTPASQELSGGYANGSELPSEEEVTFVVATEHVGMRLDRFLQEQLPGTSRSQLQRAIREGRVTVDAIVAPKTGLALKVGMEIAWSPLPAIPTTLQPQDLGLEFLHVDSDLVVLNKRAGMVVHPAPGHADGTVVNGLLHAFPELRDGGHRPGIVHRLDIGTSGVLAVGRSEAGREGLMLQFVNRQVFKGYLAIVCGIPQAESGEIHRPIARHPTDRKRFSSVEPGGREASTLWRAIASSGHFTLMAVRILTGRTHQIRVHLADNGWPVAGDTLYGLSRQQIWQRLSPALIAEGPLLHAALLELKHPKTGEPLRFVAPLPSRWLAAVEELFPGATARLQDANALRRLFPDR